MTIVLLSLLMGMLLGQRFKVLVLVPTIGLSIIVTTLVGIAGGASSGEVVLASIAVGTGLQIGYLAGTFVRHLLTPTGSTRLGTPSLGAPMRPRHSTR